MEPEIKIIAHIYTDFNEKFGIPRQSGLVSEAVGKIVFEPEYRNPDALKGIEEFSHLWLIWQFSENILENWQATVRPPRLGGKKTVGVFATRSPMRPNPIGLSSVKLEKVEKTKNDGDILVVCGADLMNGTPIYDIKPYLPYTDSHPDAKNGFAEVALKHKLYVHDTENCLEQVNEEKRSVIAAILEQDPRPAYKNDPEKVYGMSFGGYNIRFNVDGDQLYIIEIKNDV